MLAAIAVAAGGVIVGVTPYPWAPSARADEVTASDNNMRNGWDALETTGSLTPSTLTSGTFGELFDTPVVGQVYAQPIVIGSSVIVATEDDNVYSINAATGAVNWQKSLGAPWPAAAENCTDLTPDVGVTSTPVYDPASGYVYLVAEVVPPGSDDQHPAFYMHALNPATGAERPGWPTPIRGAPTNDPTDALTPLTSMQRPGLLLTDGSVFAGFGSHCDFEPYKGYIVGVNVTATKSEKAETIWTDEAGISDTMAGIWQSGSGLVSDGDGHIIFSSGNGISPAPGPGDKPPAELAESVVRLAVQPNGSLLAKDFFSPSDAPRLDAIDGDLGSGGPVGLPFGTAALPHLLVEAGKFEGLFVLDRDNLGGRRQGAHGGDAVVSAVPTGLQGEYGRPAAFADTPVLSTSNAATANDYVYYVGKKDALRYLKAGLGGSNGVTPILSDVGQTSDQFGYTSGSPVVTSNGADINSAVVWAVNTSGENGTTGMLQAFPAVPSSTCTATSPCTIAPLWSFPLQRVAKFTIPATSDGRVFIGTRGLAATTTATCGSATIPAGTSCAQVYGFGSPSLAPLGDAAPITFSPVAVGGPPGDQGLSITNVSASPVTIESVATASSASANPFGQSGPYVINGTTNCTVSPGPSSCEVPPNGTFTVTNVTFNPASAGAYSGTLQLGLDPSAFPNFPVVNVSLSGTATQPGFYTSASSINFGSVPVGTTASQQMTITNGDASAEKLQATLPGSPFTVTGLPSSSQPIPPGATIPVSITYKPTSTTSDNASLTLTGSASDITGSTPVNLSGAGIADINPTLTATQQLNFGSVPVGQQAKRTIVIANSGNLPAVITATSALRLPFATTSPVPSGLPITPGSQYFVRVPVTFTPASAGKAAMTYNVTWTDAAGTHHLAVTLTGTGALANPGTAVPPPGGGWTFNGSAFMTGRTLSLNFLSQHKAGSAVYSIPAPSRNLSATFTVRLGGGTGADGMTFALLDAGSATTRALGAAGPGLGFAGLQGVAVALDTRKEAPSYPSGNFVGIATGATSKGLLRFAATSTHVPDLRRGAHVVRVSVSKGTVDVEVDGTRVLSKKMALPKLALAAFTAATGTMTDHHRVTNVHITAGGQSLPPPGGGWSYNGSAGVSGSDTALTSAKPDEAGSVVYPFAVPTVGLGVTFNAQFSSSTGGDGLTLALLNPKLTTAQTVGQDGLMLGLGTPSGVPGLGVALGTASNRHDPAPDFLATTTHAADGQLDRFQRTAFGVGSFATATHTISVFVKKDPTLGVVINIWFDRLRVLREREPDLPPTVRLAFTAGTSATLTNLQIVKDIAISTSG